VPQVNHVHVIRDRAVLDIGPQLAEEAARKLVADDLAKFCLTARDDLEPNAREAHIWPH